MASSFKRGSKSSPLINGTKLSVQNSQLLTSTGVESLDYYLGGGLPVGTVLLLEELGTTYSEHLLKYFLGEGIACGHSVFISSTEKCPNEIIKELPALETSPIVSTKPNQNEKNLKIAWRYQLQSSNNQCSSQCSHRFNLATKMSQELLSQCRIISHIPEDCNSPKSYYKDMLSSLKKELGYLSTHNQPNNLLRIALNGLGSPSCWSQGIEPVEDLLRTIYMIKCLMRSTFAVCCITLPLTLYQNPGDQNRIRRAVDFAVGCDPFNNIPRNAELTSKDYHGLFHIRFRQQLNSLVPISPDVSCLVFLSRRKGFLIETLHLPPASIEPIEKANKKSSVSCGSLNPNNSLDF